jgi:hypothetical protein
MEVRNTCVARLSADIVDAEKIEESICVLLFVASKLSLYESHRTALLLIKFMFSTALGLRQQAMTGLINPPTPCWTCRVCARDARICATRRCTAYMSLVLAVMHTSYGVIVYFYVIY